MAELQQGLRVAYQGEPGSYSHLAVEHVYGGQAFSVPQPTFAAVFHAVRAGTVDVGLVPLENSYAGRVKEVARLLDCPDLTVIGDYWHLIDHCLLCLAGQTLSQIRQVWSHPQALAQCDAFLGTLHEVELVPTLDTAGSAKRIREEGVAGVAAIASRRAAELYHLAVLAEGIQTRPDNRTHFLLVRWARAQACAEPALPTALQALRREGRPGQAEVFAHTLLVGDQDEGSLSDGR